VSSRNIQTIDLGQSPPKVYGPFLTGSLGTSGEILDIAVTPDSTYALVANFTGHKVYRIDISDPTNPVLAGSIDVGSFYPEDIAISPNGQFAVISDGSSNRELVFINLSSFSNYSLYAMTSSNLYAQAVAIGNDNSTVIMCDYYTKRIVFGRVNASLTGLVSENNCPSDGYPINITISPDGQTVLVANSEGYLVGVYQIVSPGNVVIGSTPKVTGFHERPQSIAFSPDGKKAYAVCSNTSNSFLTFSWLQVNGPGNVTMGGERVTNLRSYGYYEYFGIDALAVSPDGSYAIVGNGSSNFDSRNRVSLINLSNFQVTAIDATLYDVKGVAIFSEIVYGPTNAGLERKTNNYIFYKEYINTLTWQANSKNKSPISKYRIYRKAKDAADSTYQQMTEVDSSVFQYTERGLKKDGYYTYRITSINNRGIESPPTEIGN
jgi:DNA-binding beta-propeller fold protein YncE